MGHLKNNCFVYNIYYILYILYNVYYNKIVQIVLNQGNNKYFLSFQRQIVRNENTPPHRSCIDTVVIIARGFIRAMMNRMILWISGEFHSKHIVQLKPPEAILLTLQKPKFFSSYWIIVLIIFGRIYNISYHPGAQVPLIKAVASSPECSQRHVPLLTNIKWSPK